MNDARPSRRDFCNQWRKEATHADQLFDGELAAAGDPEPVRTNDGRDPEHGHLVFQPHVTKRGGERDATCGLLRGVSLQFCRSADDLWVVKSASWDRVGSGGQAFNDCCKSAQNSGNKAGLKAAQTSHRAKMGNS